jgi:hypothetical protein
MHYEMEAANRRSSNGDAPVFFPKPMNRVKRFVGFASISGNDQYLWHFQSSVYHPRAPFGAIELRIRGELETY